MKTNGINDIDLDYWKEYDHVMTDSLWLITNRGEGGSGGYPGNFVPEIPRQLILRYTHVDDWVLDPFCGSGTTAEVAHQLNRRSVNVDLTSVMPSCDRSPIYIQADSKTVNYYALNLPKFTLAILHPPYHDIIHYSGGLEDLSNAPTTRSFIDMLMEVITNLRPVLAEGAHMALVMADMYKNGRVVPLGFRCMNAIMRHGFILKGIVVKNFTETAAKRNQEHLWRYRALQGGFYIFKHEYIFVFQVDPLVPNK